MKIILKIICLSVTCRSLNKDFMKQDCDNKIKMPYGVIDEILYILKITHLETY